MLGRSEGEGRTLSERTYFLLGRLAPSNSSHALDRNGRLPSQDSSLTKLHEEAPT